jgi:hypothetical protein
VSQPDLEKLEALARNIVWQTHRPSGITVCEALPLEELADALLASTTGPDGEPITVAMWLLLEIKALRSVEDEARKLAASSDDERLGYLRGALRALDASRRERA